MQNQEAVNFLASLLNKTLRVHISDNRFFVGQFKCTDKDRNIILATAQEYRKPSEAAVQAAAAVAGAAASDSLKLAMTPRFVGLIVVPGQHITKIEVEGR